MASKSTGSDWWYAPPTGGISNTTTAVTIAPAVSGQRNFIDSLQISSGSLGGATEFVIRDGAGGTVLHRVIIPAGGYTQGYYPSLEVPISGSKGNLLEVACITAVTGNIYFNCQGFTTV